MQGRQGAACSRNTNGYVYDVRAQRRHPASQPASQPGRRFHRRCRFPADLHSARKKSDFAASAAAAAPAHNQRGRRRERGLWRRQRTRPLGDNGHGTWSPSTGGSTTAGISLPLSLSLSLSLNNGQPSQPQDVGGGGDVHMDAVRSKDDEAVR